MEADRLQRKAYCGEPGCERKAVVIRIAGDGYSVECSTSAGHNLSIAKSLFAELLERWRQGERLMSLEGLIFTNTLRVLQRTNPERWDYEEDGSGHVLRIGREYRKGETDMNTALTVQEYDKEQLNIIRTQIAPDATEEQFQYFMAVSFRSGLDPLRKQIYPIFFKKKSVQVNGKWETPEGKDMAIVTGIDGFRATASKSREHAGTDDPTYGPVDEKGYPEWCTVTTYRIVQGQRVPFTATVRWTEFAYSAYYDSSGRLVKTIKAEYADRPFNQMAVRAESHALRKGFPEEMGEIELRDSRTVVSDIPMDGLPDREVNLLTGEVLAGEAHAVPAGSTGPSHSVPEAAKGATPMKDIQSLAQQVYGEDYAASMTRLIHDKFGVERLSELDGEGVENMRKHLTDILADRVAALADRVPAQATLV